MKRILLAALALVASTLVSQAQVKVGIKAGKNISNQLRNDGAGSALVSRNAYRGYHVGAVAEVKLSKALCLQPQLLYVDKGVKYTSTFGSSAKSSTKYLEMPVNLVYKHSVGFGNVFAGVGPVLSYGLKQTLSQDGHTGKDNNWRRWDISANATAGVEFASGFFTSLSYQRGLRDVYKGSALNAKNQSLSLSVGYLINWNKRKA